METIKLALMITMPTFVPILFFSFFQTTGTLIERFISVVTLNPLQGLLHQKFFWLCIIVPLLYFLTFGYVAWSGYSVLLNAEGLGTFITISALPLGLLSIALPLTVIAASFHSTQQTAGQIAHAKTLQEEEIEAQKKDRTRILINTLTLIKLELCEAWSIYYNEYGKDLLKIPDNTPHLYTYPLGENLFPIFDSAPACLAEAPLELASEIVRTYMRIKGLITTLNNNNENCILVRERARSVHDKHIEKAVNDGIEITQGFKDHLKTVYTNQCDWEAYAIGMNAEALSLKNLTQGIGTSIGLIVAALEKYIEDQNAHSSK